MGGGGVPFQLKTKRKWYKNGSEKIMEQGKKSQK